MGKIFRNIQNFQNRTSDTEMEREKGTNKWKLKRIHNRKKRIIIIEAEKEQIQCIASTIYFFHSNLKPHTHQHYKTLEFRAQF